MSLRHLMRSLVFLDSKIHYPRGMGRSKLRIPVAKTGTARNMNTVAKLVEITSKA